MRLLLVVVVIVLLLSGCQRQPKLNDTEGFAEGTTYDIRWWSPDPVDETALRTAIARALASVDKEISTYRDDSDLQRFNHAATTDWQKLPANVIRLLVIAKTIYRRSDHCYDPTIGPLFALWGFNGDHPHVPAADAIAKTMQRIGFDKVRLDPANNRARKLVPGLSIDLSSMGEGYTLQRLAAVLDAAGVDNYLIEFGGDMYIRGRKPDGSKWRIGIEQPVPGRPTVAKAVLINARSGVSLDTSGTYQHFFRYKGRLYPHILDPRTGAPVEHHLVSASVFGDQPVYSDAWATAMVCLGKAAGEPIAERYHLKVFYIEREAGGDLSMSASKALEQSSAVTLQ